jgi:hypothetical protein
MKFFNLQLAILYIVFTSSLGLTTSLQYKNKNKHIYYKNKYYDYGEEPVLLEKSIVKKGYIKPNIIIPKYKSIAKTIDERITLPSLNASISSESVPDNKYLPTSSETNESESETDDKNIAFDSNAKNLSWKNYKSVSIMQDGKIIKPNKKESKVSNDNDYTKIDLSEDENSDQDKKHINKNLNANNSQPIADAKSNNNNNVYFAENDLDFLVNKKLRESEESNPESFTKISLQEKEKERENFKKTLKSQKKQQEQDSKWYKKFQVMIKELENKILQNPKDYDFYFKDVMFELKQDLIAEKIIEPSSYHLDDLSEVNDFERLRKIEKEKRMESLEKKILKEKDEEKYGDNIINHQKNGKKLTKNDDNAKTEIESKINEVSNKINSNLKKADLKDVKVERLNVELKKEITINSKINENNNDLKKDTDSSIKYKQSSDNKNDTKNNKNLDLNENFKFKQSTITKNNYDAHYQKKVFSDDVENTSILSDVLKSLK